MKTEQTLYSRVTILIHRATLCFERPARVLLKWRKINDNFSFTLKIVKFIDNWCTVKLYTKQNMYACVVYKAYMNTLFCQRYPSKSDILKSFQCVCAL